MKDDYGRNCPACGHRAICSPCEATAKSNNDLFTACEGLVKTLDELMAVSDGVAGLHLSGDLATWAELSGDGACCDWLGTAIDKANIALDKARGES